MRPFLLMLILLSLAPSTLACEGDSYADALCLYNAKSYEEAAKLFAAIVEKDEPQPETLKSRYFLARSQMKLGQFQQASQQLIAIYSIAPAFYREWKA